LTSIRGFDILSFVKHKSSGQLEPQTRKPWKKNEFFTNFSGNTVWTHNSKVAGSGPAPATE
jgi:hypothetical protein